MAVTKIVNGGGFGSDYSSITAWEAATNGVAGTHEGQLSDEGGAFTEDVTFNSTVGTRALTVLPGQEFDPASAPLSGVRWYSASGAGLAPCQIDEVGFVLQGPMLIQQTNVDIGGNRYCIRTFGGASCDCVVTKTYTYVSGIITGTQCCNIFVQGGQTQTAVHNNIVIGGPVAGFGAVIGIEHRGINTTGQAIQHNTVYSFSRIATTTIGIKAVNAAHDVRNNVVIDCSTCLSLHASATEDYNVVSDTSTSGSNSHNSQTAAGTFDLIGQLTVNRTGKLINNGVDLSGSATDYDGNYTDFSGEDHDGDGLGVEIGARNLDTNHHITDAPIQITMTLLARLIQEPPVPTGGASSGQFKAQTLLPGASRAQAVIPGSRRSQTIVPGASRALLLSPGVAKSMLLVPGASRSEVS